MTKSRCSVLIASIQLVVQLVGSIVFSQVELYTQERNSSTLSESGKIKSWVQREAGAFKLIENRGQFSDLDGKPIPEIDFMAKTNGATVFMSSNRLSYVYRKVVETKIEDYTKCVSYDYWRMDIELAGAKKVLPSTIVPSDSRFNYYLGNIRGSFTDVRAALMIVYEEVYEGIDLVYYGVGGNMKYDFLVKPGADVSQIRIRTVGASSIKNNVDGSVVFETPLGFVREEPPVSFSAQSGYVPSQARDASMAMRNPIETSISWKNSSEYGFSLSGYDKSKLLVIDPLLIWSTYWGGDSSEVTKGITCDIDGNISLLGNTTSPNLPSTAGSFQRVKRGNQDAFVTCFDYLGAHLWTTYCGGDAFDEANAITSNVNGDIYFVGGTTSDDFPIRFAPIPPFNAVRNNSAAPQRFQDAFAVKLKSDGTGVWSTYWGSDKHDAALCCAVDKIGNFVFGGWTVSYAIIVPDGNDFYPGSYQRNFGGTPDDGTQDGWIAKFNEGPANNFRSWSTYYGGSGSEQINGIVIDPLGNILFSGQTNSPNGATNVIASTGAHQMAVAGARDVFLGKLDSAGTVRAWGTYYGGTLDDLCTSLATDKSGRAIFVGTTLSTGGISSAGSLQPAIGGGGFSDCFIGSLNPNGTRNWATYYGGNKVDEGGGIAVNKKSEIVVTGALYSVGMPMAGGYQDTIRGPAMRLNPPPPGPASIVYGSDAFILKLDSTGVKKYSTYFGGNDAEMGTALAWDGNMSFAFAGTTYSDGVASSDSALPTTASAQYKAKIAQNDAFFTYFSDCGSVVAKIATTGGNRMCPGDSRVLTAPLGFDRYLWSTGETTRTITVGNAGQYFVRVTNADGCRIRDTIVLTATTAPEISLGNGFELCSGDTASIPSIVSQGGTKPFTYAWTSTPVPAFVGAPTGPTAVIKPTQTSVYRVIVTDSTGCKDTALVTIKVSAPKMVAGVASVDFGELDACSSSKELSVRLKNTGTTGATLDSATISGAGYAFVSNIQGIPVSKNDSTEIQIRFAPSASGQLTRTATFYFSPCNQKLTVELKGSKLRLAANTSVSGIDFGGSYSCQSVLIDTTYSVINTGTDTMKIQSVTVTAPNPFSIVSPAGGQLPLSVPPSKSTSISVRYNPTGVGIFSGTAVVKFTAGACNDSLQVALTASKSDPSATLSSTSINFPTLSGCDTRDRDTIVTITNNGAAAITLEDSTLLPSGFKLKTPLPILVQGNGQARITVSMNPVSGNGKIVFTTNPCSKKYELTVNGDKNGVSFTSSVNTIRFPTIVLCSAVKTKSSDFILTNGSTGGVNGTIKSIAWKSGNTSGVFSTTLKIGGFIPSIGLAGSAVATPVIDGIVTDTLSVIIDPCDVKVDIPVTVTATSPKLLAVALSVNLTSAGAIGLGQSATVPIGFRNSGTAPLTVTNVRWATMPSTPFTVVGNPISKVIQPDSVLFVDVQYLGTNGTQSNSLVLETTDPCMLSASVDVSGSAVDKKPLVGKAKFFMKNQTVKIGDIVSIDVELQEQENLDSLKANTATFVMHYHEKTAEPLMGTKLDCIETDAHCKLEFKGTRSSATNVMATAKFKILWGDAATTDFHVAEIRWDGLGSAQVNNTPSQCTMTIDDICDKGGMRLFNSKGGLTMISVVPHPVNEIATVHFSVVEKGVSTLQLVDAYGKVFAKETTGESQPGNFERTFDVVTIPSGVYFMILTTPSETLVTPFVISK